MYIKKGLGHPHPRPESWSIHDRLRSFGKKTLNSSCDLRSPGFCIYNCLYHIPIDLEPVNDNFSATLLQCVFEDLYRLTEGIWI